MFFGFAVCTAIRQKRFSLQGDAAIVEGIHDNLATLFAHSRDAFRALLYLADIQHPAAGDAHSIDLFAVEPVLGQQLVEAIGIAGL